MSSQQSDNDWIKQPEHQRSLRTVQEDVAQYQKLRDDGDVRSWAADQLHEDLKYVLSQLKLWPILRAEL